MVPLRVRPTIFRCFGDWSPVGERAWRYSGHKKREEKVAWLRALHRAWRDAYRWASGVVHSPPAFPLHIFPTPYSPFSWPAIGSGAVVLTSSDVDIRVVGLPMARRTRSRAHSEQLLRFSFRRDSVLFCFGVFFFFW